MAGTPPVREVIIGKDGRLSPVWAKYFMVTLAPDSVKLLEQIFSNLKNGSILFIDEHYVAESNPGLVWDKSSNQLILAFDSIAYTALSTDTDGFFHIVSSGGKTFLDDLTDNGFVKTINGTGELEIDIKTYVPGIPGTAQGQLFFWDNTLSQLVPCETSELFWDDTNKRVGINNLGPLAVLDVIGASRFGDSITNYAEFEADGTLKLNGNATVWRDKILAVSNLKPGVTTPTWAVISGSIYAYRFDAGSANDVSGSFEMQHDYKEGSNIVPHFHYSPTTTNTGNIVCGLEYIWANDDAVFAGTTILNIAVAANGSVNMLSRIDFPSIVGTDFKIGDIIAFRFYRQNGGTDTFTGDIFVHSIGIHYEVDTIGSRQITTK